MHDDIYLQKLAVSSINNIRFNNPLHLINFLHYI